MKAERKHRATGGVNEAAKDLKTKSEARTNAKIIDDSAEERKAGGRAKRKSGGGCKEGFGPEEQTTLRKARKEGGLVPGEAKHHAGRAARKSGGSCSDSNPFTSARKGTPPKGRGLDMEIEKE